jgi:hypothetical protein
LKAVRQGRDSRYFLNHVSNTELPPKRKVLCLRLNQLYVIVKWQQTRKKSNFSSLANSLRRLLLLRVVATAIALFALALVTDGSAMQIAAVSSSLLALALAVVAQKVKTKFERSYTRH